MWFTDHWEGGVDHIADFASDNRAEALADTRAPRRISVIAPPGR